MRGLIVALLGALVAVLGPSIAHARAPKGFYGVTSQTPLVGTDFRAMAKGGVGSIRVEIPWTDVDIVPADDENFFAERPYRWSLVDPTVRKAAKRGIRVLPTIYGTPHWVGQYQGCPFSCHKLGPATIQAYFAFAMFMRAAAQRYGPSGTFWAQHPNLPYRPIRTWQLWNEQNSSDFWKPEPNVQAYAGLVISGGRAVHAVDPGSQVVLGGMFGEPGQAGKITISGWNFLEQLYADPRVRDAVDGIAIHPYGKTVRQINNTVRRWRQSLGAVGALGERIWVTEIGWASGGEQHPLNLGLRGQARMVTRSLRYFEKNRRRYRFAQVYIYSWRDAAPGADNCSWCSKSGLVRYRGRRAKPAWDAFRRHTGALKPAARKR